MKPQKPKDAIRRWGSDPKVSNGFWGFRASGLAALALGSVAV